MSNRIKKANGITLIALVVTIVILVILGTISLNLLFNKNGIIKQAQLAKEIQTNAEAREKEQLGSMDEEVNKIISNIVANAPDISELNKSNTYYVTWDLKSSPYEIQETNNLTQQQPSDWYDYTKGINKWANIKTTGGGNDCYWVWIPRYAYRITDGYHSNIAGTVDIKFLKGTTNTPIDGSSITISNSSGSGNWNVHPAFWFDKNNNGVEDEGEQLTGIWVAKFEASSNSTDVVENPTVEQLATDGGGNTADLKVRVKPNVTSWRKINANNIFTVCQNLTTTGNSLESTNNLDSHMIKNTEWGAVAYLSRSAYGKNGEVWNNPYYNNTTNQSPIAGLCGKATNAKDLSTTNLNDTCKYNEIGGENASTTGNVYGIYDMAGGAWEYVAGIYIGETSNDNSSKLWDSNNSKYVDKYINTTGSRSTYYGNTDKYGDAVYETSSSGASPNDSWDSCHSYFPISSRPVFGRGGRAYLKESAGVFAFGADTGDGYIHLGFRPCLINLD